MTTTLPAPTIRRLTYADLPQVIAIERRAYPTPWSLAMFVLELSKPSGICLAAEGEDGAIKGYTICSRYDTVWHIMNVSVSPDHRRQGIATTWGRSAYVSRRTSMAAAGGAVNWGVMAARRPARGDSPGAGRRGRRAPLPAPAGRPSGH